MKTTLIYSSLSGNTEKVAWEIFKKMNIDSCIYNLKNFNGEIEGELLVLGYWVDRAKPNKEMLEFMEKLKDKKIVTFGTLGDYPNSPHAVETISNVKDLLEKNNTLLGNFLCQGKINPKITEMFKKGTGAGPHKMSDERLKKHEEAAKHPNKEDFKAAQDFIEEILKKVEKERKSNEKNCSLW